MDILSMRNKLMHAPKYDNVGWHYKVDRMSDNQVYAVYMTFLRRGLLDKPKKKPPVEEFRQMTIFDYI